MGYYKSFDHLSGLLDKQLDLIATAQQFSTSYVLHQQPKITTNKAKKPVKVKKSLKMSDYRDYLIS